ncbi:hypothetical protein BH11ACT3_BH11ACT3_16080 [soil metagenome]
MNKLVKGAIATGVGVALLMGGAGTLAYWNGSAATPTQNISAGNLAVSAGTGVWKSTANSTSTTIDIGTFRTVPGDQLTYTVPVTVTSSGDNLKFQLSLGAQAINLPSSYTAPSTAVNSQALKDVLTSGATFAISGSGNNVTLVPSTTDTYKVNAAGTTSFNVTITVNHPFGTATSTGAATGTGATNANASQNGTVVLGANALTVTQIAQ